MHSALLDVRTRGLVVIVTSLLLLSSGSRTVQLPAVALLVVLLVLARRHRLALVAAALWAGLTVLTALILPAVPGGAIAVAALAYTLPYLLAGLYGIWFVSSTGPSEMIGGLHRMRAPRPLVVSTAVMVRFLPALRDDAVAISEAMRLRGLWGARAAVVHPLRTVEYLLVPLLVAATRAGEDLGAAAMCRGLGAPVRPTSTVRLGFGVADLVVVGVLVGLVALALLGPRTVLG